MTTIATRSNEIPATMLAFAIDHYGDAGQIRELPTPTVGPGEMLVRVRAAGVNPFDLKVRAGGKPEVDQRFPLILGQDGAEALAAVSAGHARGKIVLTVAATGRLR